MPQDTLATFGGSATSFPGDAVGPLTGHIMWTTPIQSGGVVGGNNFAIQGDTYFEGSAYNQRFANPIILEWKTLLHTAAIILQDSNQSDQLTAVDLRTGKLSGLAVMYQRYHSATYMIFKTPTNTEFTPQFYSRRGAIFHCAHGGF